MGLKGKTIVVTGAAGGIGAAAVAVLRGTGAGRDRSRHRRRRRPRNSTSRMRALAQAGRAAELDGFVNAAGVTHRARIGRSPPTTSAGSWRQHTRSAARYPGVGRG